MITWNYKNSALCESVVIRFGYTTNDGPYCRWRWKNCGGGANAINFRSCNINSIRPDLHDPK